MKSNKKTMLIMIDMQNDFITGSLVVPGAVEDVKRLLAFKERTGKRITDIAYTLDTHARFSVWHACWWVDENGNHPDPFTIITAEDVNAGRWIPVREAERIRSIDYVNELTRPLCIWTYHCIQGTEGEKLHPQIEEMVYFHKLTAGARVIELRKGIDPLNEEFGLENKEFFSALLYYDEIIICGEAGTHCVLDSVKNICEFHAAVPELTQKIIILTDCMSGIPGSEECAEKEWANLMRDYGIQMKTSLDV
jgi:nicotinamidase-related amidase